MECVTKHFGNYLITFNENNVSSLLVLKVHGPNLLRSVDNSVEENSDDKHLDKCETPSSRSVASPLGKHFAKIVTIKPGFAYGNHLQDL